MSRLDGFSLTPARGRRRARPDLSDDQKVELKEAFDLFDADKKVRAHYRCAPGTAAA